MSAAIQHLYVHIPFCHRICPYCSFYKHTPGRTDLPAFLAALQAEAAYRRGRHELDLRTVYFGGGTPTFLSTTHLATLLEAWARELDFSRVEEWTVEANPRTFDAEKLALLREFGVTRLSLGVQSWEAATLATLGRDHSPAEAEEAYHLARAAGFEVVSLDLMFAIPGQDLADWERTLARTIALQPDHVSAYNLNYEEDTEFFRRVTSGEWHEDDEQGAQFFEIAVARLGAAGLEAYEVSNYARPGCESRHNQAYWEGRPYLGLGPGAVSTLAQSDGTARRWKTVPDTPLYLQLATLGAATEREVEILSPEELRLERLALQLRTRRGVPLAELSPVQQTRLPDLLAHGLAERDETILRLTPRGRLIADSVTVWLSENA